MKAAIVHEYGGPEVLLYDQAPDPVASAGEVLVCVAATSINPFEVPAWIFGLQLFFCGFISDPGGSLHQDLLSLFGGEVR
jgi:hypothetical protein